MEHVPKPSLGDAIRLRAYYCYVDRGRQEGSALDDWLAAEREVFEELDGLADDVRIEAPECDQSPAIFLQQAISDCVICGLGRQANAVGAAQARTNANTTICRNLLTPKCYPVLADECKQL